MDHHITCCQVTIIYNTEVGCYFRNLLQFYWALNRSAITVKIYKLIGIICDENCFFLLVQHRCDWRKIEPDQRESSRTKWHGVQLLSAVKTSRFKIWLIRPVIDMKSENSLSDYGGPIVRAAHSTKNQFTLVVNQIRPGNLSQLICVRMSCSCRRRLVSRSRWLQSGVDCPSNDRASFKGPVS